MPSVLRDPVTGKAITRDAKAALDESCADVCCGGCWWPLVPCECDDRPHSGTDLYWPCDWARESDVFEWEDACYRIDTTAGVTVIPDGAVEFSIDEVPGVTWYVDCDSTYEPGEEPELPSTLLTEGCCDPCARSCDSCASAYDASIDLVLEYAATYANGSGAITGCNAGSFSVAVTEQPEPAVCNWFGAHGDECIDCQYVQTITSPPSETSYPIRIYGFTVDITLHCPTAEDPDVYWRAVISLALCVDDPCVPDDECNNASELLTAEIEFRKTGVCPLGVYEYHGAQVSGEFPTPVVPSTFDPSASTLEVS